MWLQSRTLTLNLAVLLTTPFARWRSVQVAAAEKGNNRVQGFLVTELVDRVSGSPPEPDVDAKLLYLAYGKVRLSLTMTVVVTALFVAPLWPFLPPMQASAWVGAILAVVVLRYGLWVAFQRAAPTPDRLTLWRALLILGSTAAGAGWALGPTLAMTRIGGAETALFVGTLLSVSAVAMNTHAAQQTAMQAFLVAALVPPAIATLSTGGHTERILALVLLAGLVSVTLVGRRSSRALRKQLETQADLQAALAETSAAREHAEAASLAKTRFLANMSHELRTPLNAVIGAAQLLRAGPADAERQAHLTDAIQRSGTNLLGLIENILDLSRIEAGKLTLHAADFHLVECVESAMTTAALSARSKGLRLTCIVAPELPAWRHGDAARLRQVVLNLLGNAVKFTAQGDVVLRVRSGTTPHGVRVGVTDTGVGIAATSLPYVFEPFRQADDGADRRFGGSGLGLAIVRQLVDAMGGQVEVTSTPGQGSCFEFEVPLPPARRPPAEPAPLAQRVAFYEPHDASAEALASHLRRMGCDAQRCTSAAELRQCLAGWRDAPSPWLMVTADAAGAEALLDHVADLVEPDHVIAMSSDVAYEAERARDAMSVSRQLMKPITRTALVSRMKPTPDVEPASQPFAQHLLTPTELDRLTHVLVVEDDELNRSIVCGMLQHAGYRVSQAVDGHDALQVLQRPVRIDLVFMDWQMPDMDGLDVTRRLRAGAAGPAGQTVPVVALTANAFAEDRAACLAAGMNDFLTKPVLAERLLAAVRRWSAHKPETTPAAREPDAQGDEPMVFDPSVLAGLPMVVDGSDPSYADQLLQMFIDGNRQAFIAIDANLAGGDRAVLLRTVHTLKSSAAQVGAIALSAEAARQETALRQGHTLDPGDAGRLRAEHAAFEQAVARHRSHPVDPMDTAPIVRATCTPGHQEFT